ncbi:MAG: hypothetical protein B6A08_15265 [Sorangiineae bacterium NIC37A_2]|jgi:hypothetical protein|nr:MAG: hypothetical protein B6A08_15265 [Sorangiineae bacterium NIC37A_2]
MSLSFPRPLRARKNVGYAPLLLLLGLAPSAFAQGQLPDMAPIGASPGPSSRPAPSSDMPETHAAAGEESTLSAGDEPTLPDDPLAMSESVQETIGSDFMQEDSLSRPATRRRFYGLYFEESNPVERYRVLFPLWGERTKKVQLPELELPGQDRASLYLFYYNRRAPQHQDDILFPLFWNVQNPLENERSTIVGPFVNRRGPNKSDDWLFPLYMTGTRPDGAYTVIPPLLTMMKRNAEGGLNIVGPAFCSFTGGQHCDTRTASDIDLGIAPFYFFGQNKSRLYEVIPPLLHYYRYSPRSEDWLNVYGPYYREEKGERSIFHFLPVYYSMWGKDERHTTLLPFFHYGYKGHQNLLITPLFLNRTGEAHDKTFVTYLYARHRGHVELDMITPLYFHHREPSIGLDRKLFFPFLYSNVSPREQTTVFFPFYSDSERFGVSRSTWVTPIFNYKRDLDGWSFKALPSIFVGESGGKQHRVVAPLFFDFQSHTSRQTIGFPLFWRFAEQDSTSTIVANTYYHEKRYKNGVDWQFHFLPLFSYGKRPDGHFWNILFGMTGFTRKGAASELRLLYIPIELSQPATTE